VTEPGTTVAGRYRLLRRLGAGGMGSVWRATDTSLGRDVAVKSVLAGAEGTSGRAGEQRAMREARLVARIDHPHVVAIYDVVWHEDQPWLVMEYVPSRDLSEAVREDGPLEPRRAAALCVQVASALADAHRAGIVHRDVKPGNVLISEVGDAKITDFGIARGHDDATLTAAGTLWGTPAYFAPEVARGVGPTDKADVWSLGATLYFAVEGDPPYGRDVDPLVLLGRIAHQPVPPTQQAGPLAPVLDRLLDRDPDARPTMAEAVELLGLRGPGEEITQPVELPTVPPSPEPDARRRPGALVGALTVLGLVALLLLGWVLVGGNDGGRNVAGEARPSAPATTPSSPSDARTHTPQPSRGGEAGRRADRGDRSDRDGRSERRAEDRRAFTAAAMEQAVADYYALMPADTRTGFSLLGPRLRADGFRTYDDFWDGIESVSVSNLQADPSSHSVTASLVFVTKSGDTSRTEYEFGLVRDRPGERLLINDTTRIG
jgi:eukaryotic-like serine/threonine-protein kinase